MDKKSGAYGGAAGGGDTDFRKTYDREKYAVLAKEREQREREEGKARYEAKQEGRSYRRRASTPEDLKIPKRAPGASMLLRSSARPCSYPLVQA